MPDKTNDYKLGTTGDVLYYDSDTSHIVNLVCQSLLFGIGLFLNVKIIQQNKVEKHKTWLLHISHAVVTTIHFGFRVPFQAITYFVPHLSSHIGSWICYIAAFNSFYGFQELTTHSLWIALEKYILIVHHLKARVFGEDKIEKIFFWLNVMCPVFLSTIPMVTNDYDNRAEVRNCFGVTDKTVQPSNSSSSGRVNFLFCDVSGYSETMVIVPYIVQFFCTSRALVNIVVATNLLEGFFYYKIFKSMKR